MQFNMTLEYPPQPGASGPFFVYTQASILSAQDPQLRFSVKGTLGTYTKYGLDPQESVLKEGKPSRGQDYGIEDPALYGKLQVAKDAGGESLLAPELYVPRDNTCLLILHD
jgi:hypothetical protein